MKKLADVFILFVVFVALFCMSACGGSGSGSTSGTNPPPVINPVATLKAGTGINSITPSSLSGAVNTSGSATFVMASGYQNPTSTGTCAVTISGATISVTFGSSNCSSTITATAIPTSTFTASATAGIGIASVTPASQSGATGTTKSFAIVVASGYQNPAVAGNCLGTLSGTTFTVTFGSSDCAFTVTATANTQQAYSLMSLWVTPGSVFSGQFPNATIKVNTAVLGTNFVQSAIPTFDMAVYTGSNPIPFTSNGYDSATGQPLYTASFTPGVSAPTLPYADGKTHKLGFIIISKNVVTGAYIPSGNTNPEMERVKRNLIHSFTKQLSQVKARKENSLVHLQTVSTLENYLQLVSNPSLYSYVELGIVADSEQVPMNQVAPNVYAASNAINIMQPYTNPLDSAAIAKKVISLYGDNFDQIVIMNSRVDSSVTPSYSMARNDVAGIGNVQIFDNSAIYGSAGKLLGVVNESPLDMAFNSVLHEFFHQGNCYMDKAALDLTGGTHIHCDVLTSYSVGWLGTNTYMKEQPDGSFVVEEKDNGWYSDFELANRGFIDESQAYPFYAAFGATQMIGGVVPRSATIVVTLQDKINVYGPRVPSAANSQKSFRVLFILVTEKPATAAEMAMVNTTAMYYASDAPCVYVYNPNLFPPVPCPFGKATKGYGTLVTAVPTLK